MCLQQILKHEVILDDKILQCMVFKHSMLYYVIGKHLIQ